MDQVIKFLSSQKLLSVACVDSAGPWIASVYFVCSDSGLLYFISPKSSRHSSAILSNSRVAFTSASAWFNASNSADRKAVQGVGECSIVTSPIKIIAALQLHNKSFPEFSERITYKWICENVFGSRV